MILPIAIIVAVTVRSEVASRITVTFYQFGVACKSNAITDEHYSWEDTTCNGETHRTSNLLIKAHHTIQLEFKCTWTKCVESHTNLFLLIIMMIIVIIIIIMQRTFLRVALHVHCLQFVVLWCCGGRKIGILRDKNPTEQHREPITNSAYMWQQVQESNRTHSNMRASTLATAPYLFPI